MPLWCACHAVRWMAHDPEPVELFALTGGHLPRGERPPLEVRGQLGRPFAGSGESNQLLRRDAGTTTLFMGSQELALTTATGAVSGTRYYSHGGATVAVRTGTSGLDVLYADQHDSTKIALDWTTNTPTRRTFDPFGNELGATVYAPWPDKHGFLNKPHNTQTGLTDIGARKYDPLLGRFLSVDPIFDGDNPSQWNGYAYSSNNPTSKSDPTGLLEIAGDRASSSDVKRANTKARKRAISKAKQRDRRVRQADARERAERASLRKENAARIARHKAWAIRRAQQAAEARAKQAAAVRAAAKARERARAANALKGIEAGGNAAGLLHSFAKGGAQAQPSLNIAGPTPGLARSLSGAGHGLGAVGAGVSAYSSYQEVGKQTGSETKARVAGASAAAISLGTGYAGAKAGAVIGSLFGPGPGTAIGAGLGFVGGALLGMALTYGSNWVITKS